MSYTARKSLSNLLNSKWYQYAVGRCGIAMPNCFTYATARISEILGKNQPLDNVRVVGAQDLWDNYADGYTRSNYAKEGALMIWSYGQYGHVAMCEELIDTNTIAWSQSNYGGSMFDYVTGNPNGYLGMKFLGYLVHKDLPEAAEAPAPAPSTGEVLNSIPGDFIHELHRFTCTIDKLNIRRAPTTRGALTGDWYEPGLSFNYDGYVKREGYIWCSYIGKDGTRRWVAVGETNANGVNVKPYGTF